jgi:FkbM family methyltransferase
MNRPLFQKLRHQAALWRDRLSPARRRARAEVARAERARGEGFAALSAIAGRGDVGEVVFRAEGAELVLKDGRRFRYDPTDRLERLYSVPVTGEFERKETEWVRRAVKPGEHGVDAGGSFGWYAVLLSQAVGPAGRVHVFEPIPRTVRVLEGNLRRNACTNVQVHALALSDAPGTLDVFVPDIGVSGSLRLHDYQEGYETFACPVRTLDELAESGQWPRLDFIKADIEGAEFALLRGAERALARWRPRLLLEIQADSTRRFGHEPAAVFRWLAERGYVAGHVAEDGALVPVSGEEAVLPDYNFIFIPRDQAAAHRWRNPA